MITNIEFDVVGPNTRVMDAVRGEQSREEWVWMAILGRLYYEGALSQRDGRLVPSPEYEAIAEGGPE